ncbi:MAG: RnfABCDGE type electron transport complex subunit G [Bacteroidales bacterium]|jgi:electron transport complex protein RnfG|nr:RnfABCDGE type electron transport complex subunit G [Bacteroidales bacterium]MDD4703689.1 RnfABCDGE type electron transport complex subunit G [Bacteroidales bacterium]MDX9798780.1 RnfABCDGE type electron transport complex subunit G [Bacteroidales bacterium]
MAKLDSSLKNMLLSLSLISFVASAVLAVSFSLTKEPILKAQLKKQQDAIQEVLPIKDAEIGKEVEIKLDGKPDAFIIYPAQKGDELVGAAVKTYSYDGYAGKIEVMVGLDKEGTISNYTVLAASETPGLGSKINDWFKTSKGSQDIRGKNPTKDNFIVKKDGGDFDAITASTISSRAFLSSVKSAFDAFKKYQEQK